MLWQRIGLTATVAVVSSLPVTAQDGPARLLKNLNETARAPALSSSAAVGGRVVFSGPDGLWRSDGTEAGTVQLDRRYFFMVVGADDPTARLAYLFRRGELWATDGETGPRLLSRALPTHDVPRIAGRVGDRLYFTCAEALWATDGTAAGTFHIAQVQRFTPYLGYLLGAIVDGRLHFVSLESQLWSTDGTPEGTRPSQQQGLRPYASILGRAGRRLIVLQRYHWTDDYAELWAMDPADGGLRYLRTLSLGFNHYYPLDRRYVLPVGDHLYFSAGDGIVGWGLWRTDGTAEGTSRVGPTDGAYGLTRVGQDLYFVASDRDRRAALWVVGSASPVPRQLTEALHEIGVPVATATRVFFAARNDAAGLEMWTSDGTPGGTRLVHDVNPGTGDGVPGLAYLSFTTLGETVFFHGTPAAGPSGAWTATSGGASPLAAREGGSWPVKGAGRAPLCFAADGGALWVTDGTTAGTTRVLPSTWSEIVGFAALGGRAVFARTEGDLWVTDGTAAGTSILGSSSATDRILQAVGSGGRLFFATPNGLLRTDGTQAGTRTLTGQPTTDPTLHGGSVYFGSGNTLYRMEGDAAVKVRSFDAAVGEVRAAGATLFVAEHGTAEARLWAGDGSAGGFGLLREGVRASSLTAAGRRILFTGSEPGGSDEEPWSSDGTPEGTVRLADIVPGTGSSRPQDLTPVAELVFFAAADEAGVRHLWVSDGTPAGTRRLREGSALRVESTCAAALAAVAGALYFAGDDGVHGTELWQSDGTDAGTRLVEDLEPGARGSCPEVLGFAGQAVVLAVTRSDTGREPWVMRVEGLPPTVRVGHVRVAEGRFAAAARFELTLSGPARVPVSVAYRTASGTAQPVADYRPVSGRAVFPPGETLHTVEVPVVGDDVAEADEDFRLELAEPDGVVLGRSAASAVILDDDAPLIVEFVSFQIFLRSGGVTALRWRTREGATVTLGGVAAGTGGLQQIRPLETTRYVLRATLDGKTESRAITVHVDPVPGYTDMPVLQAPVFGERFAVSGVTVAWVPTRIPRHEVKVVREGTGETVFGAVFGADTRSVVVDLADGAYQAGARGCAVPGLDHTCGPWSRTLFTVDRPRPGGAPEILVPAQGAVLDRSQQRLSWQWSAPLQPPQAYEVILHDMASERVVLQTSVPHPLTEVDLALPGGRYALVVRACHAACGPPSRSVTFTVAPPPVGEAPPVTSVEVAGNDATVHWNAVPGAELYCVLVVQPEGGPGGGAVTVATRPASGTSAPLRVPPGRASAAVAVAQGGRCGSHGDSYGFVVGGTPPVVPELATPVRGSLVDGPRVSFSWPRIASDDRTNTTYRLYVQDLARRAPALDVFTRQNSYEAFLRADGARYDALVIVADAPHLASRPSGFGVSGTSAAAPTLVSPTHGSAVRGGRMELGWSPVPGARLYEFYVTRPASREAPLRGVVEGLFVHVRLEPGQWSAVVRACEPGAHCDAGREDGWGPWSNVAGPGVTNFTIER